MYLGPLIASAMAMCVKTFVRKSHDGLQESLPLTGEGIQSTNGFNFVCCLLVIPVVALFVLAVQYVFNPLALLFL